MLFINLFFPVLVNLNLVLCKVRLPHFNEIGYHHDGMIGKGGLKMIITTNMFAIFCVHIAGYSHSSQKSI